MPAPRKPTRAEIAAAEGKTVPDVIAPDLKVLLCGINPGLYTAAIGHHFGRPGNRFWPALHAARFTDRLLSPFEERELLPRRYGITNIVARASVEPTISPRTSCAGAAILRRKIVRYGPVFIAFLGITAYRTAFQRPKAVLGRQQEKLAEAEIWVLPNPSGLNAHHSLADLGRLFGKLRRVVES